MLRLGLRRCRKCEGPYDRGGEVIVSRETQPPPNQTKLVFTGNHAIMYG